MEYLNLEEFLDLPGTRQFEIVFEQGIFLERRYEENREFSLYSVNRFFVELEYEKEENLIVGKQAFISGVGLEEYISMDPDTLHEE